MELGPPEAMSEPAEAQAPSINLTRLIAVPVKDVWPTEPYDFTPWLLENAELLSEALGLDIELESREYKVGKFFLDIIGREVGTGNPVIIENQYGVTDHAHLGQILTYAGGIKPTTVVWVAEQFTEEHRAALEWLNTHTDSTIRFFGVELGAVTLAKAPSGLIAPSLKLVVKPNDWEKQAAAAASGSPTKMTALQELYREFWLQLAPRLKQRQWTNASAPAQNWWGLPTGVVGASWVLSFTKTGCRSELYFDHRDPTVNLARWQVLNDRRDHITKAFGGELIFDELPDRKGSRIEARFDGIQVTDRNRWPEVLDWMIATQARLRDALVQVGGIPPVMSASGSSD